MTQILSISLKSVQSIAQFVFGIDPIEAKIHQARCETQRFTMGY